MTQIATTNRASKNRLADNQRCVLRSAELEGEPPPGEVLIAPWGEVNSSNGRFVVDRDAIDAVIATFADHGTDLPVDYEHQSLGGAYASPTGQAPAAGWIRALRAVLPEEAGEREPGLYADVTWTDDANSRLAKQEYRYLSPVVLVRKSDRRVVALHSAALTNKPAIVGMKPIVNRDSSDPAASDPNARNDSDAIAALRMRLDLPAECETQELCAHAIERIDTLTQEANRRDAESRIASALRSGKLIPAQRDWALSLAMRDPVEFDRWVAAAPTVVPIGRTVPPRHDQTGGSDRTAVIASARAAYRAEPALAMLTSEAAWINDALRSTGLERLPSATNDG